MSDEEIIKSLKICANDGDCKECSINPHKGNYGYCTSLAIKAALDLINRQKAEIERLEDKTKRLKESVRLMLNYDDGDERIKAEAVKEFAERLKQKETTAISCKRFEGVVSTDDIDNLVKEFTEGGNDG